MTFTRSSARTFTKGPRTFTRSKPRYLYKVYSAREPLEERKSAYLYKVVSAYLYKVETAYLYKVETA